MPFFRFQVTLKHRSLLPRDNAVNVLWYDIADGLTTDTPESVADEIATVYQARASSIQNSYQGMAVAAYAAAGGPPLLAKNYPLVGSGGLCPNEVALCLSYSADDNAAGTPRRRGRIYLPWHGSSERPSAAQITALLNLGQGLASVGTASNTTWHMRSALGTGTALNPVPVFRKIESISVDDEFDTQRRRGMRAVSRTRQDVQ
jgi:hypothetical protein